MSKVKAFDFLRERIAQVQAAPIFIKRTAAAKIQDRLRKDSTTRRGNIPCYGRFGNIPTRTDVATDAIIVHGADWVLQ